MAFELQSIKLDTYYMKVWKKHRKQFNFSTRQGDFSTSKSNHLKLISGKQKQKDKTPSEMLTSTT